MRSLISLLQLSDTLIRFQSSLSESLSKEIKATLQEKVTTVKEEESTEEKETLKECLHTAVKESSVLLKKVKYFVITIASVSAFDLRKKHPHFSDIIMTLISFFSDCFKVCLQPLQGNIQGKVINHFVS